MMKEWLEELEAVRIARAAKEFEIARLRAIVALLEMALVLEEEDPQ